MITNQCVELLFQDEEKSLRCRCLWIEPGYERPYLQPFVMRIGIDSTYVTRFQNDLRIVNGYSGSHTAIPCFVAVRRREHRLRVSSKISGLKRDATVSI